MKKTLSYLLIFITILGCISCNSKLSSIINPVQDSDSITTFSLNGTAGTINGDTITVNFTNMTDLTNLIATFTTNGALVQVNGVTQVSGITANNFTNLVTYRVHAANGNYHDYAVTAHNPIAYLYSLNTDNTISKCILESDGTVSNCGNSGAGHFSGNQLMSLSFNSDYAYIVNIDESGNDTIVHQCNINNIDGSLANCAVITNNLFDAPFSLNFNNNYAYVANFSGNNILKCSIAIDGSLNCTSSISAISTPSSITFNNNYAYIASYDLNFNSESLTKCNISGDGDLSNCSSESIFTTSIAFNNNYAYIIGYNNNILKCSVVDGGAISGCVDSGGTLFNSPGYIAIFNNYAYVVNNFNNSVTDCSIESNGNLANCAKFGGTALESTEYITIKSFP